MDTNTKQCSRCREPKPLSEFSKDKYREFGVSFYCKPCDAERRRKCKEKDPHFYSRQKRKKQQAKYKWIRELKNSTPCKDCNTQYPYFVMEFDHVRGKKKFNLSGAGGQSWRLLREEIDKCDIVCALCHRIRTHRRLEASK